MLQEEEEDGQKNVWGFHDKDSKINLSFNFLSSAVAVEIFYDLQYSRFK